VRLTHSDWAVWHERRASASRVQARVRSLLSCRHLAVVAWLVVLASCGGSDATKPTIASPTPDSVATRYVALVRDYWNRYVDARGNGGLVCYDPKYVDPAMCRQRAAAVLAVHEKFLGDLDTPPPPPKFAADDQIFRSQLPKAIADVKAMISAADSNDPDAVLRATTFT
jgi:hypothetical protein